MDKFGDSMRDAFFDGLYDLAIEDRDLIIISADMNANSLNRFKKDLNSQYVDTGIAEQNAFLVASGLALSGKKPYIYAISPFVTSRTHEFAKIEGGLMKLPIKIVGVGAGFSYDESGPTHHTTEDLSIMRTIQGLEIFSPSDSVSAYNFAKQMHESSNPTYIRLDRQQLPQIHNEGYDFLQGFRELRKGDNTCIVTTGSMVHNALRIKEEYDSKGDLLGIIDLYKIKPTSENLKDKLKNYKGIISLEEHFLEGGLGSILSETITDNKLGVKLKRIGVKGYHYQYGKRKDIQDTASLGDNKVLKEIADFEKSYK